MRTLLTLLYLVVAVSFASSQTRRMNLLGNAPATRSYPFTDTLIKPRPGAGLKNGTYTPFLKKVPRNSTAEEMERIRQLLSNRNNLSPVDAMPNAIALHPIPGAAAIYQRNNAEGFDIYESGIDRMPILKPDSTNDAVIRQAGGIRNNSNSSNVPKIYRYPR